jgi:hypothetical protein
MIQTPTQHATIQADQILLTPFFGDKPTRRGQPDKSKANLKSNKVKGFMSSTVARKARKMLSDWITAVTIKNEKRHIRNLPPGRLITFVTLTLPALQFHSDKEIKRRALVKFCQAICARFGVKNYYWRAEPQKNGNIHFHVIADKFIHWRSVRNLWNSCLEKLGYIDQFERKHGHRDPNSTDIHGLRKIKSIVKYITKYCTKNSTDIPLEGHVHGRSDTLSKCAPILLRNGSMLQAVLDLATHYKLSTMYDDDFFQVHRMNVLQVLKRFCSPLYSLVLRSLEDNYKVLYGKNPLRF